MLRQHFFQAPIREQHIALDTDLYALFASDGFALLDYPSTLERVGWLELLSGKRDPLLYAREDDAMLLLLADSTYTAVAHLARVIATASRSNVIVHLDGLRGRPLRMFGAPSTQEREIVLFTICLAIVVLVMAALLARFSRRKQG